MKAVLLSIRPEHLVNILNDKKTIELRKSKLPLNVPVYLYCTKAKNEFDRLESQNGEIYYGCPTYTGWGKQLNGKVVAKCVLSGVFWLENEWASERHSNGKFFYQDHFNKACVDRLEAWKYANGKDLYAYQISNLEIFDNPKELGEFGHQEEYVCKKTDCIHYEKHDYESSGGYCCLDYCPITKAPQSWCYVEVEE